LVIGAGGSEEVALGGAVEEREEQMETPVQMRDGIGEAFAALEERLGPQIEQVREAVVSFNAKALRAMRQYPGLCLLGAVGAGFLLGRLASRR
jgi:hypothetical protein